MAHFHGDRDYFECHEILEEYWKQKEPRNKQSILVGFIQLAVSLYHLRRQNVSGAVRTARKALDIFELHKQDIHRYGLDSQKLITLLQVLISQKSYESVYLPIIDLDLLAECGKFCHLHEMPWWKDSDLSNSHLIHRHTLRDRSDVIAARAKSQAAKKTSSD